MQRPTASGVAVAPSNALAIADAWACVRVLTDAASSLPLVTYRRGVAGERTRLEKGRLPDLLKRPGPMTTQANLIGQLVAHLNLWGNAYLAKFRDGGAIRQLGLLAPDRTSVRLERGEVRYRYIDDQGHQTELSGRDLIHVRGLGVDGVVGLSPVTQAREALGLSSALSEHAARFFANDARPSGILKLGHAHPDKLKAIADSWRSRHQGLEKAHNIAVVTGEIDYTSVGMSAADAQLLESRQWSSAEVARIFRVPPSLIGAPTGDSLTYGNRESDALHFVTYSLRPWLVAIEQAISADEDLCPQGSGLFCEFLVDALLRADSATRAQVYTAALDPITGWMERSEVRRLENLPPVPLSSRADKPPTGSSHEPSLVGGAPASEGAR